MFGMPYCSARERECTVYEMNAIKDDSGILFMKKVFHIICASRKEYLLIQSHFFLKYRVIDGRSISWIDE